MMTTSNTFVENEEPTVETQAVPSEADRKLTQGYFVDESSFLGNVADSQPAEDRVASVVDAFKQLIPELTVKQLADYGIDVRIKRFDSVFGLEAAPILTVTLTV